MKTYFVRVGGNRPQFGLVVTFLWGDDEDVDTEGDSVEPESQDWTELYVARRGGAREVVDVSVSQSEPLTLRVDSEWPEIAARVAFFLATATKGAVAEQSAGPFGSPSTLFSSIGNFDVRAGLERVIKSPLFGSETDPGSRLP